MKLISLNAFGGHFFEPLLEFAAAQAADTDCFCFQEVLAAPSGGPRWSRGARTNLFVELSSALVDFHGFFAPAQNNFDGAAVVSDNISSGLAMFVKKIHPIQNSGDFFIFRERNSLVAGDIATLPHNLQYVQLTPGGRLLTVCNLHGTAEPTNKLDSPARLAQSQKILDFIRQQPGEAVLAGDFNLLPNTKSLALLEERGFRNLVKDFSVPTTRGSLLKRLHPEYGASPLGWQEFADYILVSGGISVSRFVVPDRPVSDHLPLMLTFSL